MKIVLRVDGNDKTFINDFVTAVSYKQAIKLNKTFLANPDMDDDEVLESLVELMVSVFDHRFTVEEVWGGIRYDKIYSESRRILHTLLGIHIPDENDESDEEGNETGK